MKNRNLGRFRISNDLLSDAHKDLYGVFSKVIVLRAEYLWDVGCTEYLAISEEFRKVPEGMTAPLYDVIMSQLASHEVELANGPYGSIKLHKPRISVKFIERVDNGKD